MQCTCVHSCRDCICEHCTLFASIFDPDLQVPSDYVAAEPSLRKKCKKIKGTVWPKRHCLIQAAKAEKKQSESKIKFMDMEGSSGLPWIRQVRVQQSWPARVGCLRARRKLGAVTTSTMCSSVTPPSIKLALRARP